MRSIAIPVLALGLISASPQEIRTQVRSGTPDWTQKSTKDETICRDRIHRARAANGYPAIERGPARPDKAYFIAAVDQRIEGCSVMVMRNDTRDLRPLPVPGSNQGLTPAF